jgi:hypothetical protein
MKDIWKCNLRSNKIDELILKFQSLRTMRKINERHMKFNLRYTMFDFFILVENGMKLQATYKYSLQYMQDSLGKTV